ncbi:MAG: hypothetical protein HKN68_16375 [Saprospiraceae bacterium]|nr:hypothetical protein [Saprospiraceae bacterium]
MKSIFCFILMLGVSFLSAQTLEDQTSMTFNANNYEMLNLHNYKGEVTITAHNQSTIEVKAVRKLSAKSSAKLEKAKQEVFLDSTVIDGALIVFVNAPDRKLEINEDGQASYNSNEWSNWNKSNIKKYDTKYEFILEVKMPASMDLYASNHHSMLDVRGINGKLTAKSHHKGVYVKTGSTDVTVKSHHGDVTVDHTSENVVIGNYKSHHGDIKTSFPDLSARVEMTSHHGSLYTDFDYDYTSTPVKNSGNGKKTKYKSKGGASIQIGSGKAELYYKTHHGDSIISRTNS